MGVSKILSCRVSHQNGNVNFVIFLVDVADKG